RVRALLRQAQAPAPDHSRRIAELRDQVDNLVCAIASGALRNSPALAERLQKSEAELARLQPAAQPKRTAMLLPDLRQRVTGMVERLDEVLQADAERGREQLRGILGDRIRLRPDESGRFLWADYSLGLSALTANADLMVAGAGFEPATF